jgi:DHA1 family multidrug resistance protein-like MFS transporter
MVADLIRDSPFGHVVRLVSRGKLFPYPEESDPNLWKQYVHKEKSGNMAHHGTAAPPEEETAELNNMRGVRTREANESETSSRTQVGEGYNEGSGARVDPEKGKDKHVIDWDGPTDPQNPRNWSRAKKFFVTFEICFLTFSVYIGSAIYTPGLLDVVQVFGVSQVAATLGLTLYVAGYGLGPIIWSPMSEIPNIGRLWVYIGTLCKFARRHTICVSY